MNGLVAKIFINDSTLKLNWIWDMPENI